MARLTKLRRREQVAAEAIGEQLFAQLLLDYAELRLRSRSEGADLASAIAAAVGEEALDLEARAAIAEALLERGWQPPSAAEAWEVGFRLLPYTRAKVRAPAPPMRLNTTGPVEIIFGGEEDDGEDEGA